MANTLTIEIQDKSGGTGGGSGPGSGGGSGPPRPPAGGGGAPQGPAGGPASPLAPVQPAASAGPAPPSAPVQPAAPPGSPRPPRGSGPPQPPAGGSMLQTVAATGVMAARAGVPGGSAIANIASATAAGAQFGGPIGAAASAIVTAGKMFYDKVVQSAAHFAEVGRQYNGAVATAAAMADVRKIQGDIRRADYLAPETSKFIDARSKFEEAKEDLLAELLKPFIPLATMFMEFMTNRINELRATMGDFKDRMLEYLNAEIARQERIPEFVRGIMGAGITRLLIGWRDALRENNLDLGGDFITDLFAAIPGAGDFGKDAFPDLGGFQPNIPIVPPLGGV